MFAICIELGWFGFGGSWDLFPEVRIGIVRIAWCRGSLIERITDRLKSCKTALADALRELSARRGDTQA